MLAREARLRTRADFDAVLRRGTRASSQLLVVHALPGPEQPSSRAGFVVNRSVGNAVVRNRVRRRLAALVAARLPMLPARSRLVVRALPAAAGADSVRLGGALDDALSALFGAQDGAQ